MRPKLEKCAKQRHEETLWYLGNIQLELGNV
jgi:hypothetical protein